MHACNNKIRNTFKKFQTLTEMAVISVLGPYVCPFSVSNTSVFSSNAVTVNRINKKKTCFSILCN